MPLKEEKPGDLPARTDVDGLPVYDYQPSRFCNFSGDNRMVVLLFWDLLCFGGIGSLYVLSLKYLSENADLLSAADPFEFSCEAYGEGCSHNASSDASSDASGAWAEGGNTTHFVTRDLDPWTNWQARTTLPLPLPLPLPLTLTSPSRSP